MHQIEKRIPLCELVVLALGGQGRGAKTRTARALGIDLVLVCKWSLPRKRYGFDGDIHRWLKPTVLQLAKDQNLDITAEDLLLGYRVVRASA